MMMAFIKIGNVKKLGKLRVLLRTCKMFVRQVRGDVRDWNSKDFPARVMNLVNNSLEVL